MKDKRILIILGVLILCVIIWLIYVNLFDNQEETTNISNITEITPGEEITEDQERQTMISLYYTNTETNTLMPETKVIDAKELLESPYKTLIEYLSQTPKNEKLKSSIPEGTKVNEASITGNTVVINFSKEFCINQSDENANLAIYSVVNTLTELNEVNAVKILIEGEENVKIEGTDITLDKVYTKEIT